MTATVIVGVVVAFIVVLFCILLVLSCESPEPDSEAEHTIGWHSAYGTHRVLYPDGQVSQPFSYKTACDYRELFGGKVIPR